MDKSNLARQEDRIREKLWFPDDETAFCDSLERSYDSCHPLVKGVATTFGANIQAARILAGIQMEMVLSTIKELRIQQLRMTARIESLDPATIREMNAGHATPEYERRAAEKAEQKMADAVSSKQFLRELQCAWYCSLEHHLEDDHFVRVTRELLKQATVVCWTALEVLANDLFALLLNQRPQLVSKLLKDERAKKLLDFRGVPFDALAAHGFDLSGNMGDFLLTCMRIDNLAKIKAAYSALFGKTEPIVRINDSKQLWILNQRRHLIVHK